MDENVIYMQLMRETGMVPKPGSVRGKECVACGGEGKIYKLYHNQQLCAEAVLSAARSIIEQESVVLAHENDAERDTRMKAERKLDDLKAALNQLIDCTPMECPVCGGAGVVRDMRYAY